MNRLKRLWRMELSEKEKRWGKKIMASLMLPILIFQMTSLNFVAMSLMTARAADGSGTMTVDDDDVTAGDSGQIFKFTFDPSEDMDGGAVRITIPSEWPSPQKGDLLSVDGDILVEGKNSADLDSDNDGNADVSISGDEITIDIATMSASDYFTLKYKVDTIPTLAGNYEFTTESSLDGDSFDDLSDSRQALIEIEPAAVASYQISTIANQTVGVDFNITVTAKDANGNVTTGDEDVDIKVKTGSGALAGDTSADTSSDGTDTITLKYNKVETGVVLEADDETINDDSNAFNVILFTAPAISPSSSTNDSTPLVNWDNVTGTGMEYAMKLIQKTGDCSGLSYASPLASYSGATSQYQLAAGEALVDETTYCVQVTSTDDYANSVTAYEDFNLLTSKPAVPSKVYIEEIGDPSTNGHPENVINIYNNESVSVEVEWDANLDGGKAVVKIKDGLDNYTAEYSAPISGTATRSVTVSGIDASSLQQGTGLDIYARVEDAGTNSSDWKNTTTSADTIDDELVTKDTSSPARPTTVTLADPVNLANEGAANLNVVGEDNADAYYTISSSGGGTNVTSFFALDSDGDTTTTVNTNSLEDGTLTAAVYLVDDAWNHSSSQTDTATKDATAPTVTLTAAESSTTNDSPLHITADFSENVTGFDSSDLSLGNGTLVADSFGVDGGDSTKYNFQVAPAGQGAVTVDVAGSKAVDAVGNNNTAATQLSITFDSVAPTLAFGNDVEAGPGTSDTITGDWGDASIKKWKYNDNTTCSDAAGDYDKTDVDSMTQATQTNNGKYICLYGEDAAGNHATLASTNDINIDITGPTLSFTDNVEAGPVASDTLSGSWDDASVKMWKYNVDANCPDGPSGYTDSTSIPTQADQTNNGKYICLYGADALGNESVLASANDINIDAAAPTVTAISSPEESSSQTFNITYTANDGTGVGNIYGRIFYKLNGEASWHQYDYPDVDDDYVAYAGTDSTIAFIAPQPGSYEFYVQVKDDLGNQSSDQSQTDTTVAVPTEVWVCESGNCGHVSGWDAFNTIQAGIDAVKEGANNTVNVAGSYVTTSYININKTLKLLGASATVTRSNTGAVVSIEDNDVRVEGFTLNVYAEAGSTGVYLKDRTGAIIHDNSITSSSPFGIGIYMENSDNNTISGNTITNFSGDGIAINRGSDNNSVFGNTLTGATTGSNSAINFYDGATGNMIGGNAAEDGNVISLASSGAGNLYGVYLSGTNTGNNTIKNNTFNGGTRFVQQDGGISGVTTIANNNIGQTTSPTFAGVSLNGGSAIISGNTLKNSVRPIEFWGAGSVTISGNIINGSTFDGINAGSASGTVLINGDNKIYNIANGYFGIHLQSGVDGVEIDGNEIYGSFDGVDGTGGNSANGSRGIGIETGSTGAEIINNNIHNHSWSAVVLNEAVNVITGNIFNANARGIEASASFTANNKNKFTGNSYCSACLYADGTFNLTENWWGTKQRSGIVAKVADNGHAYTYAPWYLDEAMTMLSSSDITGPAVVLGDDHADDLVNKNDTVVLTATFSDTSGLDTGIVPEITITKNSDSTKLVDGAAMSGTADANVWTYSWDVPEGDGAVTVSIEAYDIVGNVNSSATGTTTYTIDNTAPAAGTVNVPGGTYNSAQSVTIIPAGDAVATYYTLDGTEPSNSNGISGTGPIAVDADNGVTITLKFISYDLVGNSNSVTSTDYLFDKAGPVIVITRSPDRNFYNDSYSLTVDYGDSVSSTMQYQIDGGAWTLYDNPPVVVSSLGLHNFNAKGTDAAGNLGQATQVVFTIDKIAPTAAITYSDSDGKVKAGDSLTITAIFNEPMLDAPIPQITLAGVNTAGPADMTKVDDTHYTYVHTVGAGDGAVNVTLQTGTDRADNLITSTPTSGGNFLVDNIAPTAPTAIVANPASWSDTNSFDVSWTNPTTDATGIAGVHYRIDGGTENYMAGSDITSLSGLSVSGEGTHTVKVWLEDLVGNKDEANNSTVNLYYDATAANAPTVTSSTHSLEANWHNNNDPALDWNGLTDTSGIVGYSYILDQTADTDPDTVLEDAGTNKTYSDKADGTWYFHIKAKNGSGLWSGVIHRTIKIDTSTPSSSVTSDDYDRSGTINVEIATLVANPSGDQDIDLYARYDANHDGDYVDTNEFDWTNQNLIPTGNSIGADFAFNPQDRDGWYQFYSRVENNAGTWEAEPVGNVADDSTIFDRTNPVDPIGFTVTSGAAYDTWTTTTSTAIAWTAATDATSGLDGYNILWNQTSDTELVDTKTTHADGSTWIDEGIVASEKTAMTDGLWYFHIKSRDNAGNWAATTHYGPFKIDTTAPTANHSVVDEAVAGVDINVNVTDVADGSGSGIASVKVYYKHHGDSSYTSQNMTDNGSGSYSHAIPDEENSDYDVEYYISIIDGAGNEKRFPTSGDYDVDIVSAGVDHFVFTYPTSGTRYAGTWFTVVIEARDRFENVATGFDGTGDKVNFTTDEAGVSVFVQENGTSVSGAFDKGIWADKIQFGKNTVGGIQPSENTIKLTAADTDDATRTGNVTMTTSGSDFGATMIATVEGTQDGAETGTGGESTVGGESPTVEGAEDGALVPNDGEQTADGAVAPWWKKYLPWLEGLFGLAFIGWFIRFWIRRRGGGAGGSTNLMGFLFSSMKTAAGRIRMFLW